MQRPPLLRALDELGGIAPRQALVSRCGRAAVDSALRTGELVVLTRGTYSTPDLVGEPAARAAAVNGVLSHRSCALSWGWANCLRHLPLPEALMFHPDRVRAVLESVVARRSEVLCPGCVAA